MHDVSEGGVKNALYELMEGTHTKIIFDSDKATYDEEVKFLGVDALRAPSYGSLIVVSKTKSGSEVSYVCDELGVKCSLVGKVEEGWGLFIDGDRVDRPERLEFDQIYGSFTSRE
jgi:hydrogenase expression/formation protein HypE